MEFVDRVFFNPGDLVKVRHDLDNVPVMYVEKKVTRDIINSNGEKETMFLGIKCRWFDKDQKLHEELFSTKDLIHV